MKNAIKSAGLTALLSIACPDESLLQAQVAGAAANPVIIEVTGPLVIGFFPPLTEAEEENDDGGISEGLAHLGFALEDVAKCYGNKAAAYRLEVTRSITLRDQEGSRRIQISRRWERAVGLIFVAPGRGPRVVFAGAGPSSLQYLGPQAAFEYFGAKTCKPE